MMGATAVASLALLISVAFRIGTPSRTDRESDIDTVPVSVWDLSWVALLQKVEHFPGSLVYGSLVWSNVQE